MNDIFVYSDNVYTGIAINHLLARKKRLATRTFCVFAFEKKWPQKEELLLLETISTDCIILLCRSSDIYSVVSETSSSQIFHCEYHASLVTIEKEINAFLIAPPYRRKISAKVIKKELLSNDEYKVAVLFSEGNSMLKIAEMLNKSIKTISGQKRNAMRKMQANNNIKFLEKIYSQLRTEMRQVNNEEDENRINTTNDKMVVAGPD